MEHFQRTAGLASTTVEGETILVDGETTKMITLNTLGGAVWDDLEHPRQLTEVVDTIAGMFPTVERETIERDVGAFLEHAAEIGIVQRHDDT